MRAALLLLIGLGIAREGYAHEFRVQPGEFQIAPGAVLSLAEADFETVFASLTFGLAEK